MSADELAGALRDWRARAGLSQRAAAASLGVSRQAVESWEGGRRFPGGKMLLRIFARISLTPANRKA